MTDNFEPATLEDFDQALSIATDRSYRTAIEAANLLHDYYVDALAEVERRNTALIALAEAYKCVCELTHAMAPRR